VLEKLAPAADRAVIKEQRMGGLLTAPPIVQKRHGEDPSRASAVKAPSDLLR
jgi:hypothetical protein